MQTIVVVGGSGFIGQHVVRSLVWRGHEVYATYSPGKLPPYINQVHWLACDLAGPQPVKSWPERCDTLIYLAQSRKHRHFPEGTAEAGGVNVHGLCHALDYAARAGVRRFLFASSGSVYDSAAPLSSEDEAFAPQATRSLYAASKLAAEMLVSPFAKLFATVVFRIFMPYGPGQSADRLFPQLLDKLRKDQPILLHGADGFHANPIAMADVLEAVLRSLALEQSATLNLAGPEVVTLRQIGEAMGRVLGIAPRFDTQPGPAPHFVGDTSRLAQVLGWSPGIRLESGLQLWLPEKTYSLAG
ncbi:MAG: NAD(P)-dependent oxidoreductase [Gemmataceae bacterium]|nr:NAD(P)-dependent oxidoreductase [Gemmataceae bacterium]MCI0738368.1 NAD(P)-dependent oxidoreductase [Gemmataceae bacterium]